MRKNSRSGTESKTTEDVLTSAIKALSESRKSIDHLFERCDCVNKAEREEGGGHVFICRYPIVFAVAVPREQSGEGVEGGVVLDRFLRKF